MIDNALDKLGVDMRPQWIGERQIELSCQHTVKGNPGRFETGQIRVEERKEWKEKISFTVLYLSTIVSSLQLHEFGYGLRV